MDEIEELANRAVGDDTSDDDDEATPAPKKRRSSRKPRSSASAASTASPAAAAAKPAEPRAQTLEELIESSEDSDSADYPEPEENVATLGTLYAKYNVGDNLDFKVEVHRTYPKVFGGKSIEGHIDTWDEAITAEQIHSEYGGGQYRIVVVGPNPKKPGLPRHYGSHRLKLAGDPRTDRLPKALQALQTAQNNNNNPPPMQLPPPESPKILESVLKVMERRGDAEAEERRRAEERLEAERQQRRQEEREREQERRASQSGAGEAFAPVIEAERRRADEVLRANEERYRAETRMMAERVEESRKAAEEARRRMESIEQHRPSMADELTKLMSSGILRNDTDGTRMMLEKILEKHHQELGEIQRGHTDYLKSIREGHEAEKAAIRSAHERELAAERETSRAREGRVEDSYRAQLERAEERLANEREERRRDQDRFRQQTEERDQTNRRIAEERETQWRDRAEAQKSLIESTWQARHGTEIAAKDMRIETLLAETDRLRSELAVERAKQEDRGDVFQQLDKMRQMNEMVKELGGGSTSSATPAGGGGIGMGSTGGWQDTMVEGLMERLPDIVAGLAGGGAGAAPPQAQMPPQYHEGQEIMTPEGPMIAVRDPQSGQMRLAKKADLMAYQAAVQAQAQQGAQGAQGAQQPRGLPPGSRRPAQQQQRQRSRRPSVSVVPNLAEGLPKPRPPWESTDFAPTPESPPQPQPPQLRQRPPEPSDNMELNPLERRALKQIAEEVEKSVFASEEPSDFIERMTKTYPAPVLRQIVGSFSERQIAAAISRVYPQSAGATPLGQEFVLAAFGELRRGLSG